jgi:hypothetical protein
MTIRKTNPGNSENLKLTLSFAYFVNVQTNGSEHAISKRIIVAPVFRILRLAGIDRRAGIANPGTAGGVWHEFEKRECCEKICTGSIPDNYPGGFDFYCFHAHKKTACFDPTSG